MPPDPDEIPTYVLTADDLPKPNVEEGVYHRFALSFNGYREMGSLRRCARIANEAIERWRRTREVPTDIDTLRGCLFFEQRRWHHFGYGFDDETMTYFKEVVAKMKLLLTERD